MTPSSPEYHSLLLLLDYRRGFLTIQVPHFVYAKQIRTASVRSVDKCREAVVGNRPLWCRVPISKSYKCYTELLSVVHAIRSWLEIKLYQALLGHCLVKKALGCHWCNGSWRVEELAFLSLSVYHDQRLGLCSSRALLSASTPNIQSRLSSHQSASTRF